MSESILTSVKKSLGITEEYVHFDADVVMAINSSFSILTQIGVGPRSGFSISDSTAMWDDFVDPGPMQDLVKSYVSAKTRLIFDPPSGASTLDALKTLVAETEWRLNAFADYPDEEEGG